MPPPVPNGGRDIIKYLCVIFVLHITTALDTITNLKLHIITYKITHKGPEKAISSARKLSHELIVLSVQEENKLAVINITIPVSHVILKHLFQVFSTIIEHVKCTGI